MPDKDLNKYSEVTDLNFDQENPHIAICGRWQGYSANGRTQELLLKSDTEGKLPQDIIKSLEGKVPEQVLTKMSFSNKRRSLQEALETVLKTSHEEYIWVDVYDFNEDMVAFRFNGQLWAVDYESTETGVVTIGQDLRVTSNRELYIDSETGEELIKSALWCKDKNPEVEETSELEDTDADGEIEGEVPTDTPDVEDKEDIMSDKQDVVTMTQEEMQEMVKNAVANAVTADRKEQEELRKAAELKAETTELVKGMAFVDEGDVEELVKSLMSEGGEVLVKALTAAKDKVSELETELEKKAEVPEEKKEEELEKGNKDNLESEQLTNKDRTAQLADIVKAKLKK